MVTKNDSLRPVVDAAVLVSGGLDSAILTGLWARDRMVQPVYIRCGLHWENDESAHCRRFLAALGTKVDRATDACKTIGAEYVYGPYFSACAKPNGSLWKVPQTG